MCEKMKPISFALGRLQDQWKWYKMVEVDGAHKHGRHEKMLKSLHVITNVKVFATQDGGRMAGQMDKHDSLHRSI